MKYKAQSKIPPVNSTLKLKAKANYFKLASKPKASELKALLNPCIIGRHKGIHQGNLGKFIIDTWYKQWNACL